MNGGAVLLHSPFIVFANNTLAENHAPALRPIRTTAKSRLPSMYGQRVKISHGCHIQTITATMQLFNSLLRHFFYLYT